MVKVVEWLPFFLDLEGLDWEYKVEKTISKTEKQTVYPVRREYTYTSKEDVIEEEYLNILKNSDKSFFGNPKEAFMSGLLDEKEKESDARNDKITFEFFGLGYVDKKGRIRSTKVGELIKNDLANSEHLIKQLLKIQFPSPTNKLDTKTKIFPMEIVLKIFEHFDYLNKYELGFIFMLSDMKKFNRLIKSIETFRKKIKNKNKMKTSEIHKVYLQVKEEYFPENKKSINTYLDYSDALMRCLEYTGYFSTRGRGYWAKLRINEHSKMKVKILQNEYKFVYQEKFGENGDKDDYMEWFGDPYNIELPWENIEIKKELVRDKIFILKEKLEEISLKIKEIDFKPYEHFLKFDFVNVSKEELYKAEEELSKVITSLNEDFFIKYLSKTENEREFILDKFVDISSNGDDAALWLECNTWKSLVAINGEKNVKRNFKIEEDLTPKSFAIGKNNTPDMEVYFDDKGLIPEVSLLNGVKQWVVEGSSVVEHVFQKINEFDEKEIYGLFITKKINIRMIWQFYVLERECSVLQCRDESDTIIFSYTKKIPLGFFFVFVQCEK